MAFEPADANTVTSRYPGRAALRAGLFLALVVPLFALAAIVRYAVLLTVLPMLVVNVGYADLPILGGIAELILGTDGTVVTALALCATFGTLGVYGLVGWLVHRLAAAGPEERTRSTIVPLAAVACLCLALGIADFWLGALETVYANLMADLQYYGVVEDEEPWIPLSVLPALQQARHAEEFVFETDDGTQIPLDTGALLLGVRLGGWLQVLAFGLVPGALLGFGVANGVRRCLDLVKPTHATPFGARRPHAPLRTRPVAGPAWLRPDRPPRAR